MQTEIESLKDNILKIETELASNKKYNNYLCEYLNHIITYLEDKAVYLGAESYTQWFEKNSTEDTNSSINIDDNDKIIKMEKTFNDLILSMIEKNDIHDVDKIIEELEKLNKLI